MSWGPTEGQQTKFCLCEIIHDSHILSHMALLLMLNGTGLLRLVATSWHSNPNTYLVQRYSHAPSCWCDASGMAESKTYCNSLQPCHWQHMQQHDT